MPAPIDFIVFAIQQAKKAEDFGFTRNECCRNLKIALQQYWQNKKLGLHPTAKKKAIRRSKAAFGLPLRDCVVEHTVPQMVIVNKLMELTDVSPEIVSGILEKLYTVRLVTYAEHERLSSLGLRSRMPSNWDGLDILHRYREAGIEIQIEEDASR